MRIRIPRFLGAKLYPKYMNCKCRFKGIKEGMFWYEILPIYYWEFGKIFKIPPIEED